MSDPKTKDPYAEGRDAYYDNTLKDDNPYPPGPDADEWALGWQDEKMEDEADVD